MTTATRAMKNDTVFSAIQFTPTEFYSAQDKADYANRFVKFFQKDCPLSLFSNTFYTRTSHMWSHIAHYSKSGFYSTWFSTDETKLEFVRRVLNTSPCGGPRYTFSDVERALRAWVEGNALESFYACKLIVSQEASDRAELARLTANG